MISLDSMKVYRGLDVATAKPDAARRAETRFHLLDVLDPHETMSVARYVERATACETEVLAAGRVPIFSGGTALYLKALTEGLFDGPPRDEALRAELRDLAAREGPEALHAQLQAVDPPSAEKLHPRDLRRVIRALEVWRLSGIRISEQKTQWDRRPRADRLLFCLDWPRPELYRRIDARVAGMVEAGLFEEVRKLRRLPRGLSREAQQAIGVREPLEWMEAGEPVPRAEVVAAIQRNTRRFAKRQCTFFRHFPDLVRLDPRRPPSELVDRIAEAYRARRPRR